MMEEMKPTGERLLPGISDEHIQVRQHHLAYEFSVSFVEGKKF